MPVEYSQIPLRRRSAHEIADSLELGILFNLQERVSRATVHTALGEEPGIALNVEEGSSGYGDVEAKIAPLGSSSAEKNEKGDIIVSDVLRQFAFRLGAFGRAYPFKYNDGILELKNTISAPHSLYIFLLISSNLAAFKSKGLLQTCAGLFEEVCADAMRGFLHSSALVKRFGSSSDDRRKYFGTRFNDAIKVLGKDIRVAMGAYHNEAGARGGDGGLDVVGSAQFPDADTGHSTLVVFGQCATGEDWQSKIYESSADKWRRWFDFMHPPSNLIFIPRCYRDSNGTWPDSKSYSAILVDRVRICHLTKNKPRDDIVSLLADNKKFGLSIQF